MIIQETKIPIYDVLLTIVYGDDKQAIRDLFRESYNYDWGDEDVYAHTLLGTREEDGLQYSCIYIVFCSSHTHRSITPGTIAHECQHAVEFTFKLIGATIDIDNSEPNAYLLGYITDLVQNVIEAGD